MPLKDGTNDEREDPTPPLVWSSLHDLGKVVLHENTYSPPCVKVRMFLSYFKVPFERKNHIPGFSVKRGGSYTKIPVLSAGDRTVNDSYVILKFLIPLLTGAPVDEAWETKLTYSLQPALIIEATDLETTLPANFLAEAGIPSFVVRCIKRPMAKIVNKGVRKNNPGVPSSVEVGKEFKNTMCDKPFFGGEKPSHVDISYYATVLVFVQIGIENARVHLEDAGLVGWWRRMTPLMPSVFPTPPKITI